MKVISEVQTTKVKQATITTLENSSNPNDVPWYNLSNLNQGQSRVEVVFTIYGIVPSAMQNGVEIRRRS
jgi:hypothetical protein